MDLAMFSQIAEITDALYLSSAAAVRADKVRNLGITAIINITLEMPNLQLPNLECIQIQVDDAPSARLDVYFERLADKINQVACSGGKTLVHCVAGISRSASICIAYLMKYHSMNLEKAYRHVKRKRSVIHPNKGFWRQLIQYERRLFGRNSVEMVLSNVGWVPDVYLTDTRYVPAATLSRASSLAGSRHASILPTPRPSPLPDRRHRSVMTQYKPTSIMSQYKPTPVMSHYKPTPSSLSTYSTTYSSSYTPYSSLSYSRY